MKKLSRNEMKKVMGGGNAPGGGTACQNDSDCKKITRHCVEGDMETVGRCYSNPGTDECTCHWAGCAS